jgi:non-heme chloroperoxidase
LTFFGANRAGATVSQGVLDTFWLLGMRAGLSSVYDCIKVFSETDLTEDLKKIDVPTLIIQGAGHGLPTTLKDRLNADLLEFCRAGTAGAG